MYIESRFLANSPFEKYLIILNGKRNPIAPNEIGIDNRNKKPKNLKKLLRF